MRWFYDCEFARTAPRIVLVSLAMVSEDGQELYRVSSEFDPLDVHPFVRERVLPQLPPASTWVPRSVIAQEVEQLLAQDDDPVLWAWYGAYDHVALGQLWGEMPALPRMVPRLTLDVRQLWEHLGRPALPAQPGDLHDALADARHVRARWGALAERAYRLGLTV